MPGKRWTTAETKSLRRQWGKAQAVAQVRVRGRSENSVKRKLIRENLLKARRPAREPWTAKEEAAVRKLVAKGMTARQIYDAGAVARSYDSIAQKISRLGLLVGRRRSQRLRDCRRLHGVELDEFLSAVREYGETRHTQWFVWKFAVGRGKVKRALARVGKSVTWRDAMELPQTKARFVSRVSHASCEAWARRREAMKESMVGRLRELEAELERKPELARRSAYKRRQCTSCKANWFASTDFFKASYKRLPEGKRKRYLQRSCRICTSGKRGTASKVRTNEHLARELWYERLDGFEKHLIDEHAELFRDPVDGKVVRWAPFLETLSAMPAPDILSLAESIVATYSESGVNKVLANLEVACFDGEPELHVDVWELDEMVRKPAAERPPVVREGKLLAPGRELAIRLYRVLRLPGYAKSLV